MKVKISLIAIVIAGLIVAGACGSSIGSIGSSSSPAYSALTPDDVQNILQTYQNRSRRFGK